MFKKVSSLLFAGVLVWGVELASLLYAAAPLDTIQHDMDAVLRFGDADGARAMAELLYGPVGPPAGSVAARLLADPPLLRPELGEETRHFRVHPDAAVSDDFLMWAPALGFDEHEWTGGINSRTNLHIERRASLSLAWPENFADAKERIGLFHDSVDKRRPTRFFRKLDTFRLYVEEDFRALVLPMGPEQAYEAVFILPNHPWLQKYSQSGGVRIIIIRPDDEVEDPPPTLPTLPETLPAVVPLQKIIERMDAALLSHVRSEARERAVYVALPQAIRSRPGITTGIVPNASGLSWMGIEDETRVRSAGMSARDSLDLHGWTREANAYVQILLPWNTNIGGSISRGVGLPPVKTNMPVPPVDFIADHPFAFLIVEVSSGRVLAFQPEMRGAHLPRTTPLPPIDRMDTGWMGTVVKRNYPWLYERTRGYFYAETLQASGTWAYRPQLGWTFFTAAQPNLLYSVERGGWLLELSGQRRFFDFAKREWFGF